MLVTDECKLSVERRRDDADRGKTQSTVKLLPIISEGTKGKKCKNAGNNTHRKVIKESDFYKLE